MAGLPINTLSRRPKKSREPLSPAADPESIPAARNVAGRQATGEGTSSGGGIDWPIVQQPYTGATYYNNTTSDGLFMLEFGHEIEWVDNDGAGDTVVMKLDDPNSP